MKGKVGEVSVSWSTPAREAKGKAAVTLGSGESRDVEWRLIAPGKIEVRVGARRAIYGFGAREEDGITTFDFRNHASGRWFESLRFLPDGESATGAAGGSAQKGKAKVKAQMPGKIVKLLVEVGARVEKGQSLLVMEAMKMENEIKAPISAKVTAIKVQTGQAVESGAELLLLEDQPS